MAIETDERYLKIIPAGDRRLRNISGLLMTPRLMFYMSISKNPAMLPAVN